jgi:predicted transcriptional regulator
MIQFISFTEVVAKIEEGLVEKGFTVADLCRKAGIAQTTWGRWKGGKFEPRDKTKQVVIDAYNALIEGAAESAAP